MTTASTQPSQESIVPALRRRNSRFYLHQLLVRRIQINLCLAHHGADAARVPGLKSFFSISAFSALRERRHSSIGTTNQGVKKP